MNDLFHQFDRQSGLVQKKELRPHQVNAIALAKESFRRKNRRTVIQLPTGGGKTVIASSIIDMALAKGNRAIFTAPAISLIDQTVAAFEAEGISDIGVMQAKHPRTNASAMVQVASVQTLANRDIPEASIVLVDEAHISARVIDRLMQDRPDVYFVGLSATPWRKGMGMLWQDLVVPITMRELIEQGWLSQYTAYAPDVPDLSGVKVAKGEYVESQLAELMGEAKIMGNAVQNWLARGEDRPTLVFGVNCQHAKELAEAFTRAGVATAYVDANVDTVERQMIGYRFKAGEIRVICSVRTMTTGVDLPVSCIVDCAPTRSEMLHVQKLGRGMRINPGTEDLKIFDHAGNLLRLGMPDEIHHGRLDVTAPGEPQKSGAGAEKLPALCSECGAIKGGLICPACGHEAKPFSGVTAADGDLRQISGKVKRATPEDKQRWFSGLLWIGRSRGYKDGWAANKYREKIGVWPRGLDHVAAAPDAEITNWVKSRQIAFAKAKAKESEHAQ